VQLAKMNPLGAAEQEQVGCSPPLTHDADRAMSLLSQLAISLVLVIAVLIGLAQLAGPSPAGVDAFCRSELGPNPTCPGLLVPDPNWPRG
jgi:hypothetical protein